MNRRKKMKMIEPTSRRNGNKWAEGDPDPLWLLTPDELEQVPDGTILTCINGTKVTKGQDFIDGDTRYGLLAYGLLESQIEDG